MCQYKVPILHNHIIDILKNIDTASHQACNYTMHVSATMYSGLCLLQLLYNVSQQTHNIEYGQKIILLRQ